MSIGFKLPFSKATGSIGYFETTDTELAAVTENLRSLLITNWGERVMHYNFGCNFREFLFENYLKEEVKQRIADRIITQVSMWLPFVSIDDLNILTNEDDALVSDNTIKIVIRFKMVNRPDFSSVLTHTVS